MKGNNNYITLRLCPREIPYYLREVDKDTIGDTWGGIRTDHRNDPNTRMVSYTLNRQLDRREADRRINIK